MQQTNSRFFSLMVVGEQPNELVKKYDKASKIEPYVKYKYLNAKKYQDNAIKVLTKLLENKDVVGLQPTMKESLEKRLETLQMLTPFEYYRELTDGMYYNEDGDALCDDNPNGKYNTCKIGRNFAPPLKLKDGTESYQALAKNVDWEAMNGLNKGIYEAAWELVVEGTLANNAQINLELAYGRLGDSGYLQVTDGGSYRGLGNIWVNGDDPDSHVDVPNPEVFIMEYQYDYWNSK